MSTDQYEQNGIEPLDIIFRSTGLSSTEIAAVTAVLAAAIAEGSSQEVAPAVVPSAWQRTQRNLRSPLLPGTGAWRSFGPHNG